MIFNISKDAETKKTTYTLITDNIDLIKPRFTDIDRRLFDECSKSESVADKLLALETPVRRIEETADCLHDWTVYGTALSPAAILVECDTCLARGTVEDYTDAEWNAAYSAPGKPYAWRDNGRVRAGGS